jgi:hypothetical protein
MQRARREHDLPLARSTGELQAVAREGRHLPARDGHDLAARALQLGGQLGALGGIVERLQASDREALPQREHHVGVVDRLAARVRGPGIQHAIAQRAPEALQPS